jgi:uncharacterized protein (DUF1697 family)
MGGQTPAVGIETRGVVSTDMPRYVALLRGVSPMNAKMPALVTCFAGAGFTDVKTVLASGNVVFRAGRGTIATLEARALAAMEADLPRAFPVIVRAITALEAILATDPFGELPAGAKRVVTFLRQATKLALPAEVDGARIVAHQGTEVFTAYVPSPRGPVFMALLEKTFGKEITTRTWETVAKIVKAAGSG